MHRSVQAAAVVALLTVAAPRMGATATFTAPPGSSSISSHGEGGAFTAPLGRQPIVRDDQIDRAIDPRLPFSERTFMRSAMIRIPASYRSNVLYLTYDGKLHSNRLALLRDYSVGPPAASDTSVSSNSLRNTITNSTTAPTNCPQRGLGGNATGEFRRVIVGCTGYTSQSITFSNTATGNIANDCVIANSGASGSAYILGGAYNIGTSSAGVDAGMQYTTLSGSNIAGYNGFFAGQSGSIRGHNATLPCGGLYGISVTLRANTSKLNTFVLNDSYTDINGNNGQSITLMADVPTSSFSLNADNFVVRRCTCLGAATGTDGSWFGFPTASSSLGPVLSQPEIAYNSFQVSGPASQNQAIQVTTTIGYAQRNPSGQGPVYCSHDPNWIATNFNTYEGMDDGNANAVGTFPGAVCIEPSS